MGEQPPRRRRGRRGHDAGPVEGAHHLAGTRAEYRRLAGQMEILAYTTTDELFAEREQWLWDQLWALGVARAAIEDARAPAGSGEGS